MKTETTILLVKELEKIKSNRLKYSYFGAWIELFVSLILLAKFYLIALEKEINQSSNLFYALVLVILLVMLLQSFFVIIQHLTNKKFLVIIEALLEKKDSLL